jgi:hypothetical protein
MGRTWLATPPSYPASIRVNLPLTFLLLGKLVFGSLCEDYLKPINQFWSLVINATS